MKIYINSKHWSNINTTANDIINNSKFIIDKNVYSEFYTYSGIFRLINNYYYKCDITDGEKKEPISYNNYDFIFDTSVVSCPLGNNNKHYQLPYQHHHRIITEYKIKTVPKSTISLNFLVNTLDEVEDWYFVTKEEFYTIKEDIFEFLSEFN